jgi:hypothetical protein
MLQICPRRLAAAFLVLFAFAAEAPGTLRAAGVDSGQMILTRENVQRFLTAYPKVRAIGTDYAKREGKQLSKVDDPLSMLARIAGDEKLHAGIDSAVKEHGFAGLNDWLKVCQSIALAYASIKKPNDSKIAEEMEKAIAKIQKTTFLPEHQKKELIKKIREQARLRGYIDAPKQNIELVRAMKDDIDAILISEAK